MTIQNEEFLVAAFEATANNGHDGNAARQNFLFALKPAIRRNSAIASWYMASTIAHTAVRDKSETTRLAAVQVIGAIVEFCPQYITASIRDSVDDTSHEDKSTTVRAAAARVLEAIREHCPNPPQKFTGTYAEVIRHTQSPKAVERPLETLQRFTRSLEALTA